MWISALVFNTFAFILRNFHHFSSQWSRCAAVRWIRAKSLGLLQWCCSKRLHSVAATEEGTAGVHRDVHHQASWEDFDAPQLTKVCVCVYSYWLLKTWNHLLFLFIWCRWKWQTTWQTSLRKLWAVVHRTGKQDSIITQYIWIDNLKPKTFDSNI